MTRLRTETGMDILLANPRGFCAGVDRAIAIVERALARHGAPIYVRHEVVHNRTVVDDLKRKGAIFVDELDQVPEGKIVVFSAHGVSPQVREHARQRNLTAIDATPRSTPKRSATRARDCRSCSSATTTTRK